MVNRPTKDNSSCKDSVFRPKSSIFAPFFKKKK